MPDAPARSSPFALPGELGGNPADKLPARSSPFALAGEPDPSTREHLSTDQFKKYLRRIAAGETYEKVVPAHLKEDYKAHLRALRGGGRVGEAIAKGDPYLRKLLGTAEGTPLPPVRPSLLQRAGEMVTFGGEPDLPRRAKEVAGAAATGAYEQVRRPVAGLGLLLAGGRPKEMLVHPELTEEESAVQREKDLFNLRSRAVGTFENLTPDEREMELEGALLVPSLFTGGLAGKAASSAITKAAGPAIAKKLAPRMLATGVELAGFQAPFSAARVATGVEKPGQAGMDILHAMALGELFPPIGRVFAGGAVRSPLPRPAAKLPPNIATRLTQKLKRSLTSEELKDVAIAQRNLPPDIDDRAINTLLDQFVQHAEDIRQERLRTLAPELPSQVGRGPSAEYRYRYRVSEKQKAQEAAAFQSGARQFVGGEKGFLPGQAEAPAPARVARTIPTGAAPPGGPVEVSPQPTPEPLPGAKKPGEAAVPAVAAPPQITPPAAPPAIETAPAAPAISPEAPQVTTAQKPPEPAVTPPVAPDMETAQQKVEYLLQEVAREHNSTPEGVLGMVHPSGGRAEGVRASIVIKIAAAAREMGISPEELATELTNAQPASLLSKATQWSAKKIKDTLSRIDKALEGKPSTPQAKSNQARAQEGMTFARRISPRREGGATIPAMIRGPVGGLAGAAGGRAVGQAAGRTEEEKKRYGAIGEALGGAAGFGLGFGPEIGARLRGEFEPTPGQFGRRGREAGAMFTGPEGKARLKATLEARPGEAPAAEPAPAIEPGAVEDLAKIPPVPTSVAGQTKQVVKQGLDSIQNNLKRLGPGGTTLAKSFLKARNSAERASGTNASEVKTLYQKVPKAERQYLEHRNGIWNQVEGVGFVEGPDRLPQPIEPPPISNEARAYLQKLDEIGRRGVVNANKEPFGDPYPSKGGYAPKPINWPEFLRLADTDQGKQDIVRAMESAFPGVRERIPQLEEYVVDIAKRYRRESRTARYSRLDYDRTIKDIPPWIVDTSRVGRGGQNPVVHLVMDVNNHEQVMDHLNRLYFTGEMWKEFGESGEKANAVINKMPAEVRKDAAEYLIRSITGRASSQEGKISGLVQLPTLRSGAFRRFATVANVSVNALGKHLNQLKVPIARIGWVNMLKGSLPGMAEHLDFLKVSNDELAKIIPEVAGAPEKLAAMSGALEPVRAHSVMRAMSGVEGELPERLASMAGRSLGLKSVRWALTLSRTTAAWANYIKAQGLLKRAAEGSESAKAQLMEMNIADVETALSRKSFDTNQQLQIAQDGANMVSRADAFDLPPFASTELGSLMAMFHRYAMSDAILSKELVNDAVRLRKPGLILKYLSALALISVGVHRSRRASMGQPQQSYEDDLLNMVSDIPLIGDVFTQFRYAGGRGGRVFPGIAALETPYELGRDIYRVGSALSQGKALPSQEARDLTRMVGNLPIGPYPGGLGPQIEFRAFPTKAQEQADQLQTAGYKEFAARQKEIKKRGRTVEGLTPEMEAMTGLFDQPRKGAEALLGELKKNRVAFWHTLSWLMSQNPEQYSAIMDAMPMGREAAARMFNEELDSLTDKERTAISKLPEISTPKASRLDFTSEEQARINRIEQQIQKEAERVSEKDARRSVLRSLSEEDLRLYAQYEAARSPGIMERAGRMIGGRRWR